MQPSFGVSMRLAKSQGFCCYAREREESFLNFILFDKSYYQTGWFQKCPPTSQILVEN